jgi:hypothetical protein
MGDNEFSASIQAGNFVIDVYLLAAQRIPNTRELLGYE